MIFYKELMETMNIELKKLLEDQINYRLSEISQIKMILMKKYNINNL